LWNRSEEKIEGGKKKKKRGLLCWWFDNPKPEESVSMSKREREGERGKKLKKNC
jgi:hypothetical protein